MAKDSGGFVKSKAKGTVNFLPFENLDDASLREINRYQIYPFGKIQEYCRHIPYNSGKKDFFDKTGRESFEVFQYIFKVPGDGNDYTVMWDYNVGLVRMTPFFKCCKYSKTQPAKMLNMNPGLREITHSITGGSIMAQGYWMPFHCAKAVCATFCASVAGALIPIFGPDFPSQCISPEAPEHGRMVIDPLVVADSTREAELFRRMFANANSVVSNSQLPHHHISHHSQLHGHHYSHGPALSSPTSIPSPRLGRRALDMQHHGPPHDFEREHVGFDERMRFKRAPDSPYGTDSEPEMHVGPETLSSLHHVLNRGVGILYPPLSPPRSSGRASGWTVANCSHPQHPHHAPTPITTSKSTSRSTHHSSAYRERDLAYACGISGVPGVSPNPLLSAIPRFGHVQHLEHDQHPPRRFPQRLPPIPTSVAWHENTPHGISAPTIKRSAAEVEAEYDEYDDRSDKSSPMTTVTTNTSLSRASAECQESMATPTPKPTSGVEKSAALLLLNLSVRDREHVPSSGVSENKKSQCMREDGASGRFLRSCGPESTSMSPVSSAADGHRSKRRRATST